MSVTVTLERGALAQAMQAVGRVIERRNTIPILANVLLRAEPGGLTIIGTDLDIRAETRVAAEVSAPGAITVPAGLLGDIAKKLPDGAQVALAWDAGAADHVALKAGRSRFRLQALPEADYPDFDASGLTHAFDMPAAVLSRALGRVEFAISTEETRYYLNGVHLHLMAGADGAKLAAVATDGHRLARVLLPLPAGLAEDMPPIIVPRKTALEIARLVDKAEGEVRVELGASKIAVGRGATRLVSKLIDGVFPDYLRVIPAGNDKAGRIDREAFAGALERVTTVAGERGRAVKFAFAPGRCALEVTNPDAGAAVEEVDAEFAAAPIEIGFNGRYLADILAGCEGRTVTLELGDPGGPAIVRDDAAADVTLVLMPMRV
jgi:DNA polymerase-3 subunit beta